VGLGGRRISIALALSLATALAACGDDDDDTAGPVATTVGATGATTASSPGEGGSTDATTANPADDDGTTATSADDEGAEAAATTTAASAGGSAGGGARERCPLTLEQIAGVLGVEVEEEGGACLFFPVTGGLEPRALYVQQTPIVCDESVRSELGYDEELDGLGVEAYVAPKGTVGAVVLVCTDPPFEVNVDHPSDPAVARTQAEELARLVLAG
jgi:hypothetical protein